MIHVAIALAVSRHNSSSRLSAIFSARTPRSDGPVSPAAPPTRGNNHPQREKEVCITRKLKKHVKLLTLRKTRCKIDTTTCKTCKTYNILKKIKDPYLSLKVHKFYKFYMFLYQVLQRVLRSVTSFTGF